MIYSDPYKFIFYAVPKTGSRSVQDHLQKFGIRSKTGWDPNHDDYEIVKKKIGEERSKNYLKIAFFRNPWSLLVSLFFYNRLRNDLSPDKKTVIEWLNMYRGGDPYIPYIFDKDGNVILDFIGKLENINEDLKILCDKLHLPVPKVTPYIGKQSVRGKLPYQEYYESPILKEKVKNMFSKSNTILKYELI